MRAFYILITVIICCSLSLNLQGQNTTLRNQVLQQLNVCIDSCHINLITTQPSPLNDHEIIMVIPVVVEGSEEEGFMEMDRYIVIADAATGKIHNTYYGTGANGWTSDAVKLWAISIDETAYTLSPGIEALGVRAYFRNFSRYHPYEETQLTLLLPEADSLRPVLSDHTMEMSHVLEAWYEECDGVFEVKASQLQVLPGEGNTYGDIQVTTQTDVTYNYEDTTGECVDSTSTTTHQFILRYQNGRYR